MSSPTLDVPAPLLGYSVTSGNEISAVRDAVNSFTCDEHELRAKDDDLKAVVNGVQIGSVGLLFVRYGADVEIVAPPTGRRIVVAVPLGPMRIEGPAGRSCVTTNPFVLSRAGSTSMIPDAVRGCIVGAVDATELEDTLLTTIGTAPPLRFMEPGEQPANTYSAGVVTSTWTGICQHLDTLGRAGLGSAAQRLMAEMLMSSMLVGLPHSARPQLAAAATDSGPAYVTRAIEYLEANLAEPLSMRDVASAVGVSVRQLNTAFRMHRNTTPTLLLRELRLARAHQQLINAGGDHTVSSIASDCGFTHFGRFSSYYAERYGCSPSDTLRRRLSVS
ncbi:AraC family transcriptional regulator [Rhodococcus sp. T2V]|uniref:AraC family transcriptional regulator n=1 Tax=Rhodococcus sp. T2V TaxID=3034164 RepID=UPI0023E1D5B3|nr:AraC family transcriptional regulator [Rhodococcus sp. T2V]MDF3306432.1 AraC family transcriptional regulator [Rhodococcus sp. T2V]